MHTKFKRVLSYIMTGAMALSMGIGNMGLEAQAAETSSTYKEVIEFEDANRYEQNGSNYIDSSMFSGYSGSGYLYLVSGWGEVNFTVPYDGEYKITLVSNADTYKENWLYLDENGAGTLYTSGNCWQESTYTVDLTAGEHKFGVSTSWGYTALDYAVIEAVDVEVPEATAAPTEKPTTAPTAAPTEKPTTAPTSAPTNAPVATEAPSDDAFSVSVEFEDAQRYEENRGNYIDSSMFSGYSGSGYLYLVSGWGEVGFSVPETGTYEITLVSNADSYKENWLYLDSYGVGTLTTYGNNWQKNTYTANLSAGEHKFGVSTSWGYTALDYVTVKQVVEEEVTPTATPTTAPTATPTAAPDATATPVPVITPAPTPIPGEGLYVSGSKLYDANGNEFMMRGINVAHAWYTDYTETSIDAIADLGANCVRVVCADGTQWTKTTTSEIENIVSWCEENGLICILEVHDHTGFDDVSRLNTAVNYWLDMKDFLNEHKDYVIVNIANEWLGTWGMGSTWTSAYQNAIKTMRNAGIENVLMIDAAGYGQETATCIDNCQSVLSADSTGNTMFSIHMYSVAGKDENTVKSNIDSMISKGVAFCIGEFGDYQNYGDVDEATIMSYCTEKEIGYIAWSWKGNGGSDITLDLSNDWEGTSLTTWGNYVFNASGTGIKDTSVMAYTGTTAGGSTGEVVTPVPTPAPSTNIPSTELSTEISAGLLEELDGWYVSAEGDDTEAEATTIEALSNGGFRMTFDRSVDEYPYLCNMVAGYDMSDSSTLDVVIRNNNLFPIQIMPIFKVGDLWEWNEFDKYQDVPAQSTVMLSFDLSSCPDLDEVMSIMLRIQGNGGNVGTVDFLAMMNDYDYDANPYEHAIDELNRPTTAAFFSWEYAENSFTKTTSYECSDDGVITINFAGVTSEDAAGPQTETRPGTGTGFDCSPYNYLTSTITNNSDGDIHVTLVMKTTGDWVWQENCGTVDGEGGELVIAPGETVDVVYELNGSEWKSAATNWVCNGELDGADDTRAIAYKLYASEGETVSGEVTISNFAFEF